MKLSFTRDLHGGRSSDAPATQIEEQSMWLANREVEVGLRNLAVVA